MFDIIASSYEEDMDLPLAPRDLVMHLSKEKWVSLPKSIPVFIVYFTAWVDKRGQLNFRDDIYGHDKKMSEKMFVK